MSRPFLRKLQESPGRPCTLVHPQVDNVRTHHTYQAWNRHTHAREHDSLVFIGNVVVVVVVVVPDVQDYTPYRRSPSHHETRELCNIDMVDIYGSVYAESDHQLVGTFRRGQLDDTISGRASGLSVFFIVTRPHPSQPDVLLALDACASAPRKTPHVAMIAVATTPKMI